MGASHEAKESGAMEGMMRQMVMAGVQEKLDALKTDL